MRKVKDLDLNLGLPASKACVFPCAQGRSEPGFGAVSSCGSTEAERGK